MEEDRRYATQRQLGRIEVELERIGKRVDELITLKAEVYGAVKFLKIIAAVIAAGAAAWAWIASKLAEYAR